MLENRREPRRRTLKAATVSLKPRGTLSCVVRNVSSEGAALEFGSPFGIPEQFTLRFESGDMQHECQVIWRRQNRVGVRFLVTANVDQA